MATVKSYTSLPQSKVLAKILPLESADMYYSMDINLMEHENIPTIKEEDDHFILFQSDIPCWSLAALLSALPKLPKVEYDLVVNSDKCYLAFDDCSEKNVHEDFDGATPVDAVFNAIIWLKENNYIDK